MRLIVRRRGGADARAREGARTPHRRGAALRAFTARRGRSGRQGERINGRPLNEALPETSNLHEELDAHHKSAQPRVGEVLNGHGDDIH